MNTFHQTISHTLQTSAQGREPLAFLGRSGESDTVFQLPLPVEVRVNRIPVDIGSIAYSFAQLNDLLDSGLIGEYWTQGLEILRKQLHARLVSFSLLDMIPGTEKTRLYHGETIPAVVDAILQWENLNLMAWKSTGASRRYELDQVPTSAGQYQLVYIPIIAERIIPGSVSMAFDLLNWLSPKQHEAITKLVASFVANGMRAANLQSSRSRLEQSYTLFTSLHSLTSTLELRSVLEHAIDLATSALNAEAATIFRVDDSKRRLVFMVSRGSVADELEERYIPITEGVAGWTFAQGKHRVFNDMSKCEMFDSSFDKATGFNTRNILCVPLRVLGEKIGVLEVLNKKDAGGFTEDDLRWLMVIADQVAVALKNADLYDRQRREQERLIKAQEDVRHLLARELHDNTAQMLSLIAIRTEMVRDWINQGKHDKAMSELMDVEQIARQANREVRTLLYELRPIILESKGLIPALESYHQKLTATMDCNMHLSTDLLHVDMNLQDASGIFSIIQEAVNNLRKYAQADNAWVRVRVQGDEFIFEVEDDGLGFDISDRLAHYDTSGSFGLLNMRERATILGGELQIESPRVGQGNGTLVRGTVPMAGLKARAQNLPHYWSAANPNSAS